MWELGGCEDCSQERPIMHLKHTWESVKWGYDMWAKLLLGKVKYKVIEQLPHVHYPLKDNMHKAVLPSLWSHWLVLLVHSTWHSTADTHQVQKCHFACKMAKYRFLHEPASNRRRQHLIPKPWEQQAQEHTKCTWRTTHRSHQWFLTCISLISNKDLQQGIQQLPAEAVGTVCFCSCGFSLAQGTPSANRRGNPRKGTWNPCILYRGLVTFQQVFSDALQM